MFHNDLFLVDVVIFISFSKNSGWISTSLSAVVSAWILGASLTSSSNCFQTWVLHEPKIPHKNYLSTSWLSSRSGKYSSWTGHCLTNSQTGFTPNFFIWAWVSWSQLCASGSESRVVSGVYNNSYLFLLCKIFFEEEKGQLS